ncbi:SDR family oxidoreductase [Pelagibacteraceae bacterium]|nr:SDR family oxidoreductase [Pelagibacteraceae bacterium]
MDKNIFTLKNKRIFVVGGSGLIGDVVCDLLHNLGAEVFNLDIKDASKNKINYLKFDISKKESIEKKLNFFFKKYGTPDCLINCSYPVSAKHSKSSFKNVSQRTITENLNLHLNSYIWIARITAESMRKKKIKGSIIQFGSHYGVIGQNSEIYKGTQMNENMYYSAIKGGIISNTRHLCSHYGKWGIRANCICPGGIKGHVKGKKFTQPKKFIRNYSNRTPLKRLAEREEIAPAVAFLASDASSYITGVTLMIDGGWTAS